MSSLKRAWLYVMRKRVKSALIFLIIIVVATLALSGISIKSASNDASASLKESFGGGFVVQKISGGKTEITKEVADEIAAIDGIKGYNAECIGPANLKTTDGKYLTLKSIEGSFFANDDVFKHQANLYGYTDTANAEMFTAGSLTLKEGRYIEAGEKNVIMIHKELAKMNNLKLGDKMVVAMNDTITSGNTAAGNLKEEATIVGIFDSTVDVPVSAFSTPGDLLENTVLMDMDTTIKLLSWAGDGYYNTYYSVNNQSQMESIIQKVKELDIFDPSSFQITPNDTTYQSAATPLNNLNSLITTLLTIIIIISVSLLSLLLTMWTKSRIHESGILLSIGIKKGTIILQRIVEVAMIAVLAFGLSYYASTAIAQSIGNTLIANAVAEENTGTQDQATDGSYTLGKIPTNTEEFAKIDVAITPNNLLWVFSFGSLIIIFSVLLSSVQILRIKPKELLTKRE